MSVRQRSVYGSDSVALVDLVNRVLDRGVVISGEVVVSVAEVDLLYLNLRLLLTSVETIRPRLAAGGTDAPQVPPGDS